MIKVMRRRMHFYPGMGATSAMYGDAAWTTLDGAVFHNWPAWRGEGTLSAWARRLIDEHHIEPGDIVAGSSLGGMVAAEIANQVKVGGLILIGSAARPDEISRLLAALHPLIDLAPVAFIQRCAGKVPQELSGMFAMSDPHFIRAMVRAIFQWEGLQGETPLLRIHGRQDRVIPPLDKVDCLIDGGHLIAMSHPKECVEAIISSSRSY